MIKTQNVEANFPTSYSQNAAKQIGKNHGSHTFPQTGGLAGQIYFG